MAGLGYVSCGFNGGNLSDLYEYDPMANTWTAKAAPYATCGVRNAVGLGIGSKGYIMTGVIGCGTGGNRSSSTQEYNPATNTWTGKADVPVPPLTGGLDQACGFVLNGHGYVATGASRQSGTFETSALYEFEPVTNTWATRASSGGSARQHAVAFSVGGMATWARAPSAPE